MPRCFCASMCNRARISTAGLQQQSQPAQTNTAVSEGQRIFETTACINCHTVTGTVANGRFGPDLTHLMSRDTIASGAAPNTPENLRLWIQNPDCHQTWIQDAGHGIERSGTGRCDGLPGDASLMVEANTRWRLTQSRRSGPTRPLSRGVRLHEWVTTVDHKRLGILYILYALVFLVIGGVEATIMRIQLIRPHNNFVSPQVFNRMFTMHGTTMIFFVAMPHVVWICELPGPPDDRRARYGLPAPQRVQLLDDGIRRPASLFQLSRGDGLYGAGNAPDVGWFAYAPLTSKTFSLGHSTDFWTLSLTSLRFRQHRNGDQYHCHDLLSCAARE